MTSLLLSASDNAVSQNVSGCRLLGAGSLDFYVAAFLDLQTQPFSGVIWIDRCSSKDLFALIIWRNNWSHMKNKGTKLKSKKKGSDNAFGCDLIEHLQNSGQDGKAFILFSLKSNTFYKQPPSNYKQPLCLVT